MERPCPKEDGWGPGATLGVWVGCCLSVFHFLLWIFNNNTILRIFFVCVNVFHVSASACREQESDFLAAGVINICGGSDVGAGN